MVTFHLVAQLSTTFADNDAVKKIFCGIAGVAAALSFIGTAAAQPTSQAAVTCASSSTISATTSGAINVTETSATLVGYLNPGQIFAGYTFEYGTTTSYGSYTTATAVPAGSGNVEVTANVTGLSPSTTYHFQLIGVTQPSSNTAAQEYCGGDQAVTTASTSGTGSSSKGSLRLVGKTLDVSKKKVAVALWCLGSHTCKGSFSISSSGKRCISSKSFSLGATDVKDFNLSLRSGCRKLMKKASKHTIHGKLTATLSSGQSSISDKVTLTPKL
jgi:hypothetical protein